MDAIKALVENKSKFTHYAAVGAAFLIAAYYQLPAFHDEVFKLYGYFPQWGKELISTGFVLYAWYRNGQKPAAQVSPVTNKEIQ